MTAAGEVAQVDFGYAGKRYHPERGVPRKSWLLVMTLGFKVHPPRKVFAGCSGSGWVPCQEEPGSPQGQARSMGPGALRYAPGSRPAAL